MSKKVFTYDEVNELVPQLEYHFRQLLLNKKEMAKASLRLKKTGHSPELIGEIPTDLDPKARELYRQVRAHYQDFKRHLLTIESMGGEIKDLELGRVVFNSSEGGEVSRLVWQLGVTEEVHREKQPASSSVDLKDERVLIGQVN